MPICVSTRPRAESPKMKWHVSQWLRLLDSLVNDSGDSRCSLPRGCHRFKVMGSPPDRLFAGFSDAAAPVLCLAGRELRSTAKVKQGLFALLRTAGAPMALRSHVQVVSTSANSAVVFLPGEDPQLVERFASVAHVMAEDLLGEDPVLARESWTADKPFVVWRRESIFAVPSAYFQNRFGPGPAVLENEPAYRFARALWAIDRRERALRVLEVACASSTHSLDHFHLGELLSFQLGRTHEGIPHFRRSSELAPNESQPFTSLGIALSMIGDSAGAVAAFTRAAEAAPNSVEAWANLAQALSHTDNDAEFRRAVARAQALEPGEPITAELLRKAR